jgi:hypothetical protein
VALLATLAKHRRDDREADYHERDRVEPVDEPVAGVSEDEGHLAEYCERAVRAGSVFAVALLALAAPIAGCGSGGREFDAQEFVEEVNAHGAELELGRQLDSANGDARLYEVNLGDGGGGTLTVLDSEEDAEAEHARCDRSGLFCYRAANVVLLFEPETTPESLAKIAKAFKALQ